MAWYLSPVDVPAHVRLQIFFQSFSCQLIRFFFLSHAACGQSFHGQCFTMVGMFLEDLIGRFDGFSVQFGFVEPHQLPEEGSLLRRQALAAPFSTCFALRHGRVSTCTRATQPHTLSVPLETSLCQTLSINDSVTGSPFLSFFFLSQKRRSGVISIRLFLFFFSWVPHRLAWICRVVLCCVVLCCVLLGRTEPRASTSFARRPSGVKHTWRFQTNSQGKWDDQRDTPGKRIRKPRTDGGTARPKGKRETWKGWNMCWKCHAKISRNVSGTKKK